MKFLLKGALLCSLALSSFAANPKLVVAILVDQMRYDYLERFQKHFATNGFRLMTEQGVFMTYAHYNYVPTVTGPGHASFLSGSTPAMHGIIANDWFDRKSGKEIYCADDESVDGVGATPGKGRASPKNFTGDTLADQMRLRFQSKVIGISMKDRGAILPAGKKPAGAFWFHAKNGNFTTSTYYMEELPGWVKEFNARKRAADFVGKSWERLLDAKAYDYPDSMEGEGKFPDEKDPVFNHKITKTKDGFEEVVGSPYGNQLLEEFAEAAIEGEKLGQGSNPDLLCVSFSSIDYIGHRFGPYSQEVQDGVLRLDQQLAQFFAFLDQKIGLANVVMTLTADHGVAPTVEFAKEKGLDGQHYDIADFFKDAKTELHEQFGPGKYFLADKIFGGNVYLNHATLERKKLSVSQVTEVIREVALASGKFVACYTREQLLDGRAAGPFGALVLNGYNAERGGDIFLLDKPYLLHGTDKTGTSHGTAYSYDTHIPVLFYGSTFKPGRYADTFYITDIAPTLSAALQMNETAGNMGKPFLKALRTTAR